jgi:hypothetical protein
MFLCLNFTRVCDWFAVHCRDPYLCFIGILVDVYKFFFFINLVRMEALLDGGFHFLI